MEYTKDHLSRMWLRLAPTDTWAKVDRVCKSMGGAENLWNAFSDTLYDALGPDAYAALHDARESRCGLLLRQLEKAQARPLFRGGADYPPALAALPDAPDVLFVKGQCRFERAVAIVGSRKCTRYGSAQAIRIARALSARGVAVISGLAKGIDTAAHTGALEGGGPTVGVLGSGFLEFYPAENKALAERIISQGGGVITEYPPAAPPLPYHFPLRNRLISGLAKAVLLVEAQEKSGTHSTLLHARRQGKAIFALPGNVDAPGSALPLKMLKEGALICTGADDICAAMGWQGESPVQASFLIPDDAESDDPILRCLALEEKTLEELLQETQIPIGEMSTRLTLLELSGEIERRAGRAYARVRK